MTIDRISPKDEKLIGYLAKHNHFTTFSHCFLSFRIKMPIFVARQYVKHQVGLTWNEVSRRYVDSEPEFWFPGEYHGRPKNMKQGCDQDTIIDLSNLLPPQELVQMNLDYYNKLLDNGVAPEEARIYLPLNTMTEIIWSGSLYAFARVCRLRLDEHAQFMGTREVAQQISHWCESNFPISWKELMK